MITPHDIMMLYDPGFPLDQHSVCHTFFRQFLKCYLSLSVPDLPCHYVDSALPCHYVESATICQKHQDLGFFIEEILICGHFYFHHLIRYTLKYRL